ncbi:MAG: RNA methyltransferase [Myxococcota bacterium]
MDDRTFARLTAAHAPAHIAETLRPYITQPRQEKIEALLDGRLPTIRVAMESPSDPHNAAAVVRTAEAFGVLGVHVIATEGRALHAKSTTQGSYRWVRTHHHGTLDAFLGHASMNGVAIYGAWMDAEHTLGELPVNRPMCLLFGNENRGLSEQARKACTAGFRIPMVGMSESLNLSVSAAVSMYDVTSRHRAAGAVGLDEGARAELQARHYLDSVDDRLWAGLLGVERTEPS